MDQPELAAPEAPSGGKGWPLPRRQPVPVGRTDSGRPLSMATAPRDASGQEKAALPAERLRLQPASVTAALHEIHLMYIGEIMRTLFNFFKKKEKKTEIKQNEKPPC